VSVEVRFLGSGNAFAAGGRGHACIMVTATEGRILLDCGGSALPAITAACDPSTIDAVAITHLHGDHFGGLPYLVLQQKYAPRSRPLALGGPPSLGARFLQVADGLYPDFLDDPLPFDLEFTTLHEVPVQLGPAQVSAHPVLHIPASEPHGLRVRVGGKLIAYSGDAAWSDALPALADGADLFICEATTYSTHDPAHVSARELAGHRDELRCRRIVVTHLGDESLANRRGIDFDVAEDGSVFEV